VIVAAAELQALNTVDEVAAFARVHPNTVRRAIKSGELDAGYAGAQIRIRREAVWAWLERRASSEGESG
jgi:excisionase family DNA binding protein